jgi:uncharacterized pyridoxal phosphate-containing UPF0001 family protein
MPFPDLVARLADVRGKIDEARTRGGHGQQVRIVAVTKTHGPEAVEAAMAAGLLDIGENKVQEALGKQEAMAARAAMTGGMVAVGAARETPGGSLAVPRWHLIGHLQRNKVKFLDRFSVFHAVDSPRLADAIDELGVKLGKPVDVLLEVNVSGEESKGGYSPALLEAEAARLKGLAGLRVVGAMTMAPFDADEATLRRVFAGARGARETLRGAGHPANELSMGMSGDYPIAIEEGATMVRLGTILFGEREKGTP